jgi:cyclopropane fatty-acyl-phospholipid synthase-like methyltransferase
MSDGPTPLDHWNSRYDSADYLFGTTPNAFLVSQAYRLSAGQKVLAIADGEGRNGVFLAEQGLDVHSVDFSANALSKAQALAKARGVSLKTEEIDIYHHEFETGAYDSVVAIFIQFAPPEKRQLVFDKIKQALKPGGLVLLQAYRPEQVALGTGGPPLKENMYTEKILREAFADMEIEMLEGYDTEVDEGPGHRGMSALISMVARKN